MAVWPDGVSGGLSDPTTYTMYYPWPVTYTETFVLITCGSDYVSAAGDGLQAVVGALSDALTDVPYIGPILGIALEIGAQWYGHASLNADGSVTLQFAQHYCGTQAGGIDPNIVGAIVGDWVQTIENLVGDWQNGDTLESAEGSLIVGNATRLPIRQHLPIEVHSAPPAAA